MKIFIGTGLVLAGAVGAVLLLEPFALGRATSLAEDGKIDEEVRLLQDAERYIPWGRAVSARLDDAMLRRAEQAMEQDRLDVAARAFREARLRARTRGRANDAHVMEVGVTMYARASERFQKHGELSTAADWNDSLFVFAVRAPLEAHRNAALAAFNEGLNLRVKDGKPCAALARVQWAEKGLGGVVPGLDPSVEQELEKLCAGQRQGSGGRS
jgi:hypothetical protein